MLAHLISPVYLQIVSWPSPSSEERIKSINVVEIAGLPHHAP